VVLKGGPGLMLGHGPYFRAELNPGVGLSPFHPESPAGLWLKQHPFAGQIEFHDPHRGAGGFGGSGAEFLTAWFAGRALPSTWEERARAAHEAWESARIFPGSGSDILTQAFGVNFDQPFLVGLETTTGSVDKIELRLGLTLSLFHTGRKLNTHGHIRDLPILPLDELSSHVMSAEDAIESRDAEGFAEAMNKFGHTLANLGLLAPHSAIALANLPKAGVLAAKGCGAMGADVLAVLHEGIDLTRYAQENSLAEVARLPV
jgi:hypothetical protein